MPNVHLTARQRAEFRAARALAALPPSAQVRLSRRHPVEVDGQVLEPEIQLQLALLERQGLAPIESQSPAEARVATRRQALMAAGPPSMVAEVSELEVEGAAGPLRARRYAPPEPGGPHPLLIYFHGGGFVIGDLDTHDAACRLLCRHAGVHVVAVDYRLAPEHPFPAAVDDAVAALRWGLRHAGELGADPARVAVGGDSAGANLAAVASLLLAAEGGPLPALQLLVYPTVDTRPTRSRELFSEGFFLTLGQMEWFTRLYADGADGADLRLSPLRAADLRGLPATLVVTAGFDPLRDEGEAYAEALRAAAVPVVLRRFSGLIHGFVNATGVSRVSHDAVVETAGAMRAMLALTARTSPAA